MNTEQAIDFADIITQMMQRGASDLHITAGAPPTVREKGTLRPLPGYPPLTPNQTRAIIYGILSNDQRQRLEENLQLDFAYSVPRMARFRINCYFQRNAMSAAFRLIPSDIKSIEDLGLPKILHEFVNKPRGLVLVTGPTGSGKSTSLAAVINEINESRHDHILTVEDPIEFLHRHKNCIVNQREIGTDAQSFALGLKAALRQDPDVILVGEMRDLETISTALTAAETGHLVFGTLHTQDTSSTIDRVIDVFPADQQEQVRVQLSMALQGVITQQLLPRADGTGRVCVCEVMIPTPAIRNLIREAKTHQIYSVLQTGGQHGMQTMDAALAEMVRAGVINKTIAEQRSSSPGELRRLVGSAAAAGMSAANGAGSPMQVAS
ncbi:MAG: type IV pilus twitching motility protein PilT [Solirubrobacterales bacterium]